MQSEDPENDNPVTIDRVEMETGWVCFQGGDTPPAPEQLPLILNDAIANWLMNHPEFKVRTVLPIVSNGNTIAVNVWFD